MAFLKANLRLLLTVGFLVFAQFSIGCRAVEQSSVDGNSQTNVAQDQKEKSENIINQTPEVCRNAYYPVGPNVTRKYHIDYPKNSFPANEFTEKYTDFSADKFVAKSDFETVSTSINWRCTPEGLLTTQYNNSIDIKKGGSSEVETLETKGISFVSENRWNVGEKWMTEYKIKETLKNPNGQAMGEGDGTVRQDYEIIGTEQITVPAGDFQTMKVSVKTLLNLTVKVNGMSVPTKVPLETTAWFAKNVGMVKSETKGMGMPGAAVTELLSYAGTQ